MHVKGFTKLNEQLPEEIRGTYAGVGSAPSFEYLRELGMTAVELLPVHHHVNDKALVDRGLTNYWGYNTIGFFAPDSTYSSSGETGGQVAEFKTMVQPPPRRHRGDPRCGLQSHRGRQPYGADAQLSWDRQ